MSTLNLPLANQTRTDYYYNESWQAPEARKNGFSA
jgi:hypothetical protein